MFSAKSPDLSDCALIVDALYGIGLNRGLRGAVEGVIRAINNSEALVVSIDTPSGLDCKKGIAEGAVVQASETLTFSVLNWDSLLQRGRN